MASTSSVLVGIGSILVLVLIALLQPTFQQHRPWLGRTQASSAGHAVERRASSPPNLSLTDPASAASGLSDHSAVTRVQQRMFDTALQEWNISLQQNKTPLNCTNLLQHFDLCDPALIRVPEPRFKYTREKPFMFLHLSKCAGTSLHADLSSQGIGRFSLDVPERPPNTSACDEGVSVKCCWWRQRLQNLSARGLQLKLLEQEPANTVPGFSSGFNTVFRVDPGFNAATDFCPDDLAYLTVLRSPIHRVHSHMCEVGTDFDMWQDLKIVPGHIKKQLRDNYYVRSLGGPDAWDAPEGGLRKQHLLAAARTLARFDVVMTVESLQSDAPAQMSRVGLPGFQWRHYYTRSRADNMDRASRFSYLRKNGVARCEIPPTTAQIRRLVAACTWDAVLFEFAGLLAARRTEAANAVGGEG